MGNGIEVDWPIIESDEMWTFVGSRENEVWLALEVNSRKVEDRSVGTFKRLWDGISDKIKSKAYTDRWDAYNI